MPELPEVRTVAKVLRQKLLNKKVTNIKIIHPKIIEPTSLDLTNLINHTLKDITTKGKYLIFNFDNLYLISHLRMEGKYFIKNINDPIIKHEHIIIEFDDISLRYHDTRKFGRMYLTNNVDNYESISKLGLEPFSQDINAKYLKDKLSLKNIPIKEALLDQTIISGLGNIYANEVLFSSKINPLKPSKELNLTECQSIIDNSVTILNKAIKYGGTTIKSYTSSLGVTGSYQEYLNVHKRENEPCKICKTPIKKIKIGGRSTYYCPNCQK